MPQPLSAGWKTLLSDERLGKARQQLKQAVDSGLDRNVRLAVTGLSQSGKTVFITALIHQLLQSHDTQALPFFSVANERRILGVRPTSDGRGSEPVFPYEQAMQCLESEPPGWPASTEQLSEVRLAIRYRPESRLHRLVSENSTFYLDIIDYPGEWLLDLPLLNMTFAQWCRQNHELFSQGPRAELSQAWLDKLRQLDLAAPADEALIARLSEQYTALLHQFRNPPQALSLIQPGRFVMPGELAGSPLLQFFPLPHLSDEALEQQGRAPEGAYWQVLEQRFNAYKEQVVYRFYKEHFTRFDRQVVLVDCLKTLNNGKQCFEDMQRAITQILHSFNYGKSGLFRRLFNPRIDKVLFASSKADHVTSNQHHNLEKFLELIINHARRDMRFEGVETHCMALSAFRSTESARAEVDGQQLSCLKGYRKGSHEPVALFPGEVPIELPTEEDWSSERFRFIDFDPPRVPLLQGKPSSHIRLDQALEYLLGDKFA